MSEQQEISIDDELLELAPDPAPTPATTTPKKPFKGKELILALLFVLQVRELL